jgi:hypothetical protein
MAKLEDVLRNLIASPRENDVAMLRALVGEKRYFTSTDRVRSVDREKRTITVVASDETRDRYGDVIRQAHWDTKNYEANPVVLFSHRASEMAVGKTISLARETSPVPALVAVIEFAEHPLAKQLADLYAGRYMNGVSVGFVPTAEPGRLLNEKGEWDGGVEFVGQELLEISTVNLPANPSCIQRAVDEKLITAADALRVFESPEDQLLQLREEVHALAVEFEGLRRQVAILRGMTSHKKYDVESVADLERLLKLE